MNIILFGNQTEEKILEMFSLCIKESLEEDVSIGNLLFLPHEYNIENTIESIRNGKAKYWYGYIVDGKLIGFMRIMQSFQNLQRVEHHFSLRILYISPQYRGKGYAQEMVHFAIDSIIQEFQNITLFHFELDVQSENKKAIELYKKMGFKESGEYKFAIKIGKEYKSLYHFQKNISR